MKKTHNLKRKWAIDLAARLLEENAHIQFEGATLDEDTRFELAEILAEVAVSTPGTQGEGREHFRWAMAEYARTCYLIMRGDKKKVAKTKARKDVADKVNKGVDSIQKAVAKFVVKTKVRERVGSDDEVTRRFNLAADEVERRIGTVKTPKEKRELLTSIFEDVQR